MDEPVLRWMADEDEEEELDEEERPHKQLAERLLDSRIVLVADPISSELAQDVISRLLLLDGQDAKAPIDIYINSPGGSVIVLLAAPKKSRLSLPNSRFLIHQPSGGVRGSATDAKIEADEILKIRSKINLLISGETGQPIEKVEEDTKRNYWMGADEARKYGLVTKVVKAKKDVS